MCGAWCMTISGERTEQRDIFCHNSGFMSDFLSFIDVELIQFFHEALQLSVFVEPVYFSGWGTVIRLLMRGMATLPQDNQELLVVKDKVSRLQSSLG